MTGTLAFNLTFMLLVATRNLAVTKWCNKKNDWNPGVWYASDSTQRRYPINTNMTGSRWFSKIFASFCFWGKSLRQWKGQTCKKIFFSFIYVQICYGCSVVYARRQSCSIAWLGVGQFVTGSIPDRGTLVCSWARQFIPYCLSLPSFKMGT